ncbi:MAG: arsenic efflux protein [Bacilli bacterium]|nr:arsenic efflux protein [Bacilli bacterium]MCH4211054.1 arsenic efflux protein [Bacilli bacterium]MCH4228479.1 arsenic efflux protein [Bacilli bacterium]MCH4277585.1 arsenic efflux protein [Bacilli bacterium]MCI2054924.1 arsenic efflux protein [Bacilli bacterium]
MQQIGEIALDSLLDSLKILAFAFVLYVILSFFEGKIASLLEKNKRWAPFFGSLAGAIPQCGISVVGADLYTKRHISMGTLVAIFVACSDEALPIFFQDFSNNKWYMVFPMLLVKIVGGFVFGYLVDMINTKDDKEVEEHLENCEGKSQSHIGCCGHEIEGKDEGPWHEHLIHPLVHSLKIFVYAFVISFAFGCLIEMVIGEENLQNFMEANRYLSPLYAVLVGLIPNCASSVIISELYLKGALPFGAMVAGLAVNAGLGPLYLFKNKKTLKEAFIIMVILIVAGLSLGYAFIWVA